MSNVRKLLNEAFQENPIETWPETPFGKALGEVCAWLNESHCKFLRASLEEGSAPRVKHLMIWPKGRRHERSIFVSAHMTERSAQILSHESPTFTDPDVFIQYIADLIKRPAFRDMLAMFKDRAAEPVAGVLRVGANRMVTLLADIQVEIAADEQHQLADAAESIPPIPRIEGMRVQITRGRYSKERQPNWLIAGGYLLKIDEVLPESDERLLITGQPVPAAKLD